MSVYSSLQANDELLMKAEDWLHRATSENIEFISNGAPIVNIEALHRLLHSMQLGHYPQSIQQHKHCLCICIYLKNLADRRLLIFAEHDSAINRLGFEGKTVNYNTYRVQICATNAFNANMLRTHFVHTRPSSILASKQQRMSIGLGDRLGIASFGHLALISKTEFYPILSQQSKRELNLTGRNYADIIDCASWDCFLFGYTAPWGADGDHLKTVEEIQLALDMGCTMITADLSNKIYVRYLEFSPQALQEEYNTLEVEYREYLESEFLQKTITISNNLNLQYTVLDIAQLALIYKDAISLARQMYSTLLTFEEAHNTQIDFEISIDEIAIPTTPETHYFIAKNLMNTNITFHSLAPRFCGEFQKGIDYIGNTIQFEQEIILHQQIAKSLGYKLSIHSGSDKFSVFPVIKNTLDNNFHIKTSGTNWIVALATIASISPTFFRVLHRKSYEVFDTAKQYYHISPDFSSKADIANIKDNKLPHVLDNSCDRQVMHIAYGEIFKDFALKQEIDELLHLHLIEYWRNLNKHIEAHIRLLVST